MSASSNSAPTSTVVRCHWLLMLCASQPQGELAASVALNVVPERPDTPISQRDRRATVAVAVQFAANGAFFASFMPRLPELRDAIGGTTQAVGALLTVASCSGLLASFTVRAVIARFGTRTALVVGSLTIAVALGLVGAASHWAAALAALAVMYFFDVYVDVAMNMQGSWLSARRRRPIISRLHGLWSLGAVAGGLAASALADSTVSLRAHLTWAAAILAVASVLIGTQLLSTDEVPADAVPADVPGSIHGEPTLVPPGELLPEALVPGSAATTEHSGRRTVSAAPRAGTIVSGRLAFFVAGFGSVTIETAGMVWAAFRLTDDLDAGSTAGALAYVAMMGGMTAARLYGDHLTERFGSTQLMNGSALLAAGGLVAAGLVPFAWVTLIAFLLAGFGTGALAPRLYDVAARSDDGGAGGLAALTAGIRAAIIVVPIGGAAIAGATSIGVAIAVLAVPAAAAFLIALPHVAAADKSR